MSKIDPFLGLGTLAVLVGIVYLIAPKAMGRMVLLNFSEQTKTRIAIGTGILGVVVGVAVIVIRTSQLHQ